MHSKLENYILYTLCAHPHYFEIYCIRLSISPIALIWHTSCESSCTRIFLLQVSNYTIVELFADSDTILRIQLKFEYFPCKIFEPFSLVVIPLFFCFSPLTLCSYRLSPTLYSAIVYLSGCGFAFPFNCSFVSTSFRFFALFAVLWVTERKTKQWQEKIEEIHRIVIWFYSSVCVSANPMQSLWTNFQTIYRCACMCFLFLFTWNLFFSLCNFLSLLHLPSSRATMCGD